MPSRLPRFRRSPQSNSIKLTHRDHAILKHAYRHRLLLSTQFIALLGGSKQQLLRRLQLLFHHGYLERPRAQIDYYHRGGTRPIVYGLGNKGARLLKEEFGFPLPHLRWSEKNQNIRRMFLEHAIVVSEVMVGIEVAVRSIAATTLAEGEAMTNGKQLKWRARVNSKHTLGVVPDRGFAFETASAIGVERTCFFLECDRGTMPIVRKNLAQTSMYRKLLAYHATWKNGVLKKQFGIERFRVLIVTTSPARRGNLVEACQKLRGGLGLFLFSDQKTLKKHPDILSSPWIDGRGNPGTILPQINLQ